MSSTRVLLQYKNIYYRFIKIKALSDGSLIILVDRNKSPITNGLATVQGKAVPLNNSEENELLPHAKFTCHTTGQVNYYANGGNKPEIHYNDPLFEISNPSFIGYYSIPNISRLDVFNSTAHKCDEQGSLKIPCEIDDRLTFVIEMHPFGLDKIKTYGIMLDYELYTIVIRLENITFPKEMLKHFISGVPTIGSHKERQIAIPEAEIGFFKKVLKGVPPLFREKSGYYIMLTNVPMRCPPKLKIKFRNLKLSMEQIMPEGNNPPSHKVKFWIKDSGGRNKRDDLRDQILSIVFDSRMI